MYGLAGGLVKGGPLATHTAVCRRAGTWMLTGGWTTRQCLQFNFVEFNTTFAKL